MSSAFSVQYPHGEHPSGSQIKHHHFHASHRTDNGHHAEHQHLHQSELGFSATETQQEILESNKVTQVDNTIAEHEHSSHSHSASHPPVESQFVAEFTHASTLSDTDITYLTLQYAPPIPPPYQ